MNRLLKSRDFARAGYFAIMLLIVFFTFTMISCKKDDSPTAATTDSAPATQAWIKVSGGVFSIGDTTSVKADTPHVATMSDFYMSNIEVTQKLWVSVMDSTLSFYKGDNLPVQCINWYDAISFCNRYSVSLGKTPCYSIGGVTDPKAWPTDTATLNSVACNFSANGFRLPTEAEWEFAAKGGRNYALNNKYYAGDANPLNVAWFLDNSQNRTHVVGTKSANELGIYDMSGNIDEWCWDIYSSFTPFPVSNPKGPAKGSYRVIRGGCWMDGSANCFVTFREWDDPSCPRNTTIPRVRADRYGMRLVSSVQP